MASPTGYSFGPPPYLNIQTGGSPSQKDKLCKNLRVTRLGFVLLETTPEEAVLPKRPGTLSRS